MAVVEYVFQNYVMLFELIGMLIMLRISAHISPSTKKLTLAVVLLLLATSILYRVEEWTQTFETLSIARPLLTAAIYSIYPVILILLMQITVTDDRRFTKNQMLVLLIPEAVSIPLFFTSQWSLLICWYREDNHYAGGPLSFWPYALFGLYCLILLIRNVYHFRHFTRENRLIFYYIVFIPMAGVVGYLLLDVSGDYSALLTSCVLVYYLYIYINMSRIDPLTSLYNRQSYYQDSWNLADRINGVISVDMNELKYLNDNFGHVEGDRALKTVSRVLRTGCGSSGVAYRVGGDEFIIFYVGSVTCEQMEEQVERMRSMLAKTPYTCAFGVAVKEEGGVLSNAIRKADERMYINKAEMKREMKEKGTPLHMRQ